MSRFVPQILKDARNVAKSTYKSKCSFAMLGTVGSGKTTVAGLITLTAITMSAYLQEQFKCDIIESASGILKAQSDLRRGRFPPKTQWNEPILYESGLLMQWNSRFRKREMHLPICDVAGEVVADLVTKYRDGMYDLSDKTMRETRFLVEQIKDRDGYILTIPAPRAPLFEDSTAMEEETALRQDPDVNLSSILEAVITYKRKHKKHPIQGIAVVVTKYDMVKDICANEGMDLYDESGVGFRNFMNTCFPATANKLRFFGLENVAFFPSEVGIHEDKVWKTGKWKGKPRINVIRHRDDEENTPCMVCEYPEQPYVRLINYLKEFAA